MEVRTPNTFKGFIKECLVESEFEVFRDAQVRINAKRPSGQALNLLWN